MNKFNNLQADLDSSIDWYRSELKTISAGVATPVILDNVKVESYGSYMALSHVATVTIEDSKTLRIVAFDKSQNKVIEQAVRDAELGLSILSDSDCVRAIFPALTTETRERYAKLAKAKMEEARIKVRGLRSEAMDDLVDLSEDDKNKKKEQVQKMIDSTNQIIESLFGQKEESILKI
jgi:ribosome recycling factor